MKKTSVQVFEELLSRYQKVTLHKYRQRLKKAKDNLFVFHEIETEVKSINQILDSEINESITHFFITHYKRGENIETILKGIKKEFHDEPKPRLFTILNDGSKIEQVTEKELRMRKFAADERELIRHFIRSITYSELSTHLSDLLKELNSEEKSTEKKSTAPVVKWTGTKEENKNEFVQLVYALHKAGFINKGKGEITKIVESLSDVFGVELSKNWQSNHSASIHKAKHNYEPPIFNRLKEAYLEYTDKLIDEKKKNK
ncbi:MAG: RteC domain-containing protein [Bacteroidota bacterium]